MIDLHLHLDGSFYPKDALDLARMTDISLGCDNEYDLAQAMIYSPNDRSLVNYLKCFDIPCSLMQTPESVRYVVLKLINKLASYKVSYAEIRFAPQLHLSAGYTMDDIVGACVDTTIYAKSLGVTIQFILCLMRGKDNYSLNEQTIDCALNYLGKGVCAIDLAGDEANNPTSNFKELFEYALRKKIPFTIHAGEAGSAEDIWDALRFGAVRIGHGIKAIDDLELLKYLKNHRIGLECCPTSNVQTGAVKSIEEHPLFRFIEKGILATVNTDNMVVSNTNLIKEFELIKCIPGYCERYKDTLINNAMAIKFGL